MSSYFEARNLDVYYDKVKALSDVSMVLGEGDIVAIATSTITGPPNKLTPAPS